MGFAVADVDAAVFVGVDAVGAGHFALEGVGGGAVAFFAGAGDEFDGVGFGVDHADGVAFAVSEPDVAGGVDGDAFGARKSRLFGGAAVASEAAFAGAGDVVDEAGFEVELEDLIAFAGGKPEVALSVEVEGAGAFQRGACDGGAVGGGAGFAGACKGGDEAGLHVDLADDVVADVTDVKIALGSELDAVRLFELGVFGGAAVATVAGLASSGEGGEDAGFHVDLADGVVDHVDDEHVALGIEAEFMGFAEGGGKGGAAVAREADLPRASDCRNGAVGADLADALASVFAIVVGAVGAADDAEGVVEVGLQGRATVAGETLFARASEGFDGPVGGLGLSGEGERKEEEERAHGFFWTGLLCFASLRAAFGRLSPFGRLTGFFGD